MQSWPLPPWYCLPSPCMALALPAGSVLCVLCMVVLCFVLVPVPCVIIHVSLQPALCEAHGSICDGMGLGAHLSLSLYSNPGLRPTHGSSEADSGYGTEQGCSLCGETEEGGRAWVCH